MTTLPRYQQNENGLVGIGASASASPQPIPSEASLFPTNAGSPTNPTSAGSAGSATPTTSSTSTSSATDVTVQYGLFAVLTGMTVFLA